MGIKRLALVLIVLLGILLSVPLPLMENERSQIIQRSLEIAYGTPALSQTNIIIKSDFVKNTSIQPIGMKVVVLNSFEIQEKIDLNQSISFYRVDINRVTRWNVNVRFEKYIVKNRGVTFDSGFTVSLYRILGKWNGRIASIWTV